MYEKMIIWYQKSSSLSAIQCKIYKIGKRPRELESGSAYGVHKGFCMVFFVINYPVAEFFDALFLDISKG